MLIVITINLRLEHLRAPSVSKHPIILHGKDLLTHRLIIDLHLDNCHAGTTALLGLLSVRLHVIGAKSVVKNVTSSCIICKRNYDRRSAQLLGQLPSTRITPAPPFTFTGADFAGLLTLKKGYTRHPVKIKDYICTYVCLTTRAVHLETVTNLAIEAFLASLKRFVARRGCPTKIVTDNGLNFVGVNNTLADVQQLISSCDTQHHFHSYCLQHRIDWSHTPGRAPHFGGIWEAIQRDIFNYYTSQFLSKETFEYNRADLRKLKDHIKTFHKWAKGM